VEATVVLKIVITLLSGVGLYASLFMLRKTKRAERGELTEPSVVQTPRARLFGNAPNAVIGMFYYCLLGAAVWVVPVPFGVLPLLLAALVAAATSLFLAYSLLFVTRMPCRYCWTSHITNWALFVLLSILFKVSYWR
jgi:uncharacterized membrane protein